MTDCLFCKMVTGEIQPDVVYEDEDVLAFRDVNPQAPTHVLVIPRTHIATTNELDGDIPILNQAIRIDKNSPAIAYITLTPLQNEIKRLKRIVGRHFGMLSEMKQAILENQQNPENAYNALPKALKDLQITHVQLTRSVKA